MVNYRFVACLARYTYGILTRQSLYGWYFVVEADIRDIVGLFCEVISTEFSQNGVTMDG